MAQQVPAIPIYGTLKGLEQSVNPQLMKYARETDNSIALARRDNRRRLFCVYPFMPVEYYYLTRLWLVKKSFFVF